VTGADITTSIDDDFYLVAIHGVVYIQIFNKFRVRILELLDVRRNPVHAEKITQ
jgi:hypothetical protein